MQTDTISRAYINKKGHFSNTKNMCKHVHVHNTFTSVSSQCVLVTALECSAFSCFDCLHELQSHFS